MSRYTVELRHLLDKWDDAKLGLGDYPIFDDAYRSTLNSKIKSHYMFDEIGFETPARFAQRLSDKMSLIMPYYNQLYLSELRSIDPFINKRYNVSSLVSLHDLKNIASNSTKNSDETSTENKDSFSVKSGDESSERNSLNSDIDVSVTSRNKEGSNIENATNHSQDTSNKDSFSYGSETESDSSQTKNSKDYHAKTETSNFVVNSDTPEGFVQTEQIGTNYVYANSGTKSVTSVDTGKGGADKDDTQVESHGNKGTSSTVSELDKKVSSSTNDIQSTTTDSESSSDTKQGVGSASDKSDKKSSENEANTSYAKNVNIITDISNAIQNDIYESMKNGTDVFSGFDGITMSEMLMKWRESFINIDKMIIDELGSLFMQVLN